ncbi:lmo0937 family membrane protein, partial [Patescibacteria group bacterium]|nr:lmo0937 family membrane protein [Patescibacteria group bacterium]
MLTFAIILAVVWILGILLSFNLGGFIHILLIAAVVMFIMH